MAKKIKSILMSGELKFNNVNGESKTQSVFVNVYETPLTKSYAIDVYAVDVIVKNKVIKLYSSSNSDSNNSYFMDKIYPGFSLIDAGVKYKIIDLTQLKLLQCFNIGYNSDPKIETIDNLDRQDTTGVSLKDYFNSLGIDYKSLKFPKSGKDIPFYFKKNNIDFSKTWNSPLLTKEEKEMLLPAPDFEVLQSWYNSDRWALMYKIMFSKHYSKKYFATCLMGLPAGGKTKFINCFCWFYGIPLVTIIGDPVNSLSKVLAQTGPVNVVDNQGNETAILKKVKTLFFKLISNNLPCCLFNDELVLNLSSYISQLAPAISDGVYTANGGIDYAKVDVSNVLHFAAYNPNTSKACEIDDKVYSRFNFMYFKPISLADKAFVSNNKIKAMYEDPSLIQNEIQKIKDTYASSWYKDNFLNCVDTECSYDTFKTVASNYFNYHMNGKIDSMHIIDKESFKFFEDEKNNLDLDKQITFNNLINDLVIKINGYLYEITKGTNTKWLNKESYFYISDRNIDIFKEYILFYGLSDGIKNFCSDLIPGCNTVRVSGCNQTSALDDDTPSFVGSNVLDLFGKSNLDQFNSKLFLTTDLTSLNKSFINFETGKSIIISLDFANAFLISNADSSTVNNSSIDTSNSFEISEDDLDLL